MANENIGCGKSGVVNRTALVKGHQRYKFIMYSKMGHTVDRVV